MRHALRLLTPVLLAATAFGLAACEEEEQNRVLYHEPGVYQGQKDTPISDETFDELRRRALRQAG